VYAIFVKGASMFIQTLDSRTAREKWRALLDATVTGRTDVVITRHGKPVTAMIAYEDYEALQSELVRLRRHKLEVYQTMLASESALRKEWETPEEDAAWADL
jgi:prevent-host-death family protein